ncbi:uncharacterized protein [Typha latifolia]|uniref:uncharacterized protein n=1 Tax=Typha latifolia TaxID=4733 RepID=UPI003C2DCCA5
MAESSKQLLDQPSKPSLLETLLLGAKDPAPKTQEKKARVSEDSNGGFLTTQVPKSQVLGKVKDFLGVMAEANEKLKLDAQNKSPADYDVEVLNGNEKEYIEMDLLMGVADLHSAEAVAAAEAVIGGRQPSLRSATGVSSDTEEDSDDDDNNNNEDLATSKLDNPGKLHDVNDDSLQKRKPNKRPKIVVLN